MKIYFATWLQEASQAEVLTKNGAKNRLLSYHFIDTKYNLREKWRIRRFRKQVGLSEDELTEYVQTGTFTDIRRQRIMEKNRDSKLDRIDALADIPNIYKEAEKLEKIRTLELNALKPEEQLDQLKDEIKIRINITKNEIFKIGEILCMAKKISREQQIKFQTWISENFEFSYETANNFMNVFKYCFTDRQVAEKLPPSILYKVSAPKFPEELREYLFDNAILENITNKSLENLIKRFKEGGIEAIENEIEGLSHSKRIQRQIQHNIDQFKNALHTIDDIREEMEKGNSRFSWTDFETEIHPHESDAKDIQRILYKTLIEAQEKMDSASREAIQVFDERVKIP